MDGWNRRDIGLVATAAALVFSRVFGLSLVLPNFRSHYEATFAVDAVWIGLAFGAYGLTMALMQLPAGLLSDRIGRKPLLIGSSLLFVLGSILAAYATSIEWLIVGRLVQGLGAISSVAMAAVGETIPSHRRTLAMALIGIPAGAGFLLGMAVGPALFPALGMQGLFLTTAAIGLLALLPVPWMHIAPASARPAPTPGRGTAIAALALGGFTSNYALTTTLFFLPTTSWKVLLPMLVVALLLVGGVSRRIDKAGWTTGPVAVGIVVVASAAAWFGLAGPMLLAGAVFFTGHAVLQSALPSQVSRVAGAAGGRGHGIQNVVAYLGTFAAGPIAGLTVATPWIAFVVLGVLAAVAAVLVLRVGPKPDTGP